ncbi:MAG: response regulator [Desulfobacteraceae bacterium]|nr:response regulator [Desulfobacteraceae bacterium]
MKILLAEDNADHRELISLALAGHDPAWQVEEVVSGEEALYRLAEGNAYDLVLLDYRLPKRDGLNVLEEFMQGVVLPPVVMITGEGDEQVAVEAMKGGAYDYVVKSEGYLQRLPVVAHRAMEAHHLVVEHRRAEQALQESEEKYRSLVESTEDSIYLVDRDCRYLFMNGKYLSRFDVPLDEVIGRRYAEFHSEDGTKEFVENVDEVFETGKSLSYEYRSERDGGYFLRTLSPVKDQEGKIRAITVVSKDITERKRAEEEKEKIQSQLLQAQKLEALGTLAGGIAHDFNNILSSIMGYTQLALDDIPKGTLLHKNLSHSLKSSFRAKDLVRQIITFSSRTEEEQKPILIAPVIKDTLKLLRASLPATIEIRRYIKVDSEIVAADSTHIHQVLMNLCTNAAHAMVKDGGILKVTLTNVELNPNFTILHPDSQPGLYVKLSVSDTGHGMSEEILEKIFDPYFTTKEKGRGTGLGLAVVHGIVKKYGGTITVESQAGKGSRFDIYLPAAMEGVSEITEITEKKEVPRGGGERILFVEDEQKLVKMGEQMLKRLGYKVVSKINSGEALELFRSQPDKFDLVITDMTMPKMTGDKLAEEIMEIRPDIPIVLYTGYNELISEERAKTLGIDVFMMKPYEIENIAKTIQRVLDGNSP